MERPTETKLLTQRRSNRFIRDNKIAVGAGFIVVISTSQVHAQSDCLTCSWWAGGARLSLPYRVSDNGELMVGQSVQSLSLQIAGGFYWTAVGGVTNLPLGPGSKSDFATDISDDGSVILGWTVGGKGIVWDPISGPYDPFGNNGGRGFQYTSVSPDGQWITANGIDELGETRGYIWSSSTGAQDLGSLPGGTTDIEALHVAPDGQTVIGTSSSSLSDREPFMWTKSGGMRGLGLPAGVTSFVIDAVASNGLRFAGRDTATNEVFAWTEASGYTFRFVRLYGADAISDDGSIMLAGDLIWDQRYGMTTLIEYLELFGVNLDGWTIYGGRDLTPDGRTIIGTGVCPESGSLTSWIVKLGQAACYADCDKSSKGCGVLDIHDYLCFQASFVSGEPYACDCDTSTGPAACDVFDFLCFQNAFIAGCS